MLAQTYDNWELRLIDNGSTDTSTKIALRYTEQYPQMIKYFEHEGHKNRGACASRNLGCSYSKGEYLAFLDADDVWLPHKLKQQVAILNMWPEAGMVYGATQQWYSWTGNSEDIHRDFIKKPGIQSNMLVRPPTLLSVLYPLGNGTEPGPSDIILRREVIERVGGFEESFNGIYQLFEDQVFLSKVYLKESVFVAGECWDKYRHHSDSCVSTVIKAGKYHTVRNTYLNWLEEYLFKQGISNTDIWKALRKALRPYRHPILDGLLSFVQQSMLHIKRLLIWIARRILPMTINRWIGFQWRRLKQHLSIG